MGDDLHLTSLLLNMQREIKTDIQTAHSDLSERITEVRAKQGEHDLRLTSLEQQTSGLGLTKAQKKALWAALAGLLLEGVRHLSTAFGAIKGVPKL